MEVSINFKTKTEALLHVRECGKEYVRRVADSLENEPLNDSFIDSSKSIDGIIEDLKRVNLTLLVNAIQEVEDQELEDEVDSETEDVDSEE